MGLDDAAYSWLDSLPGDEMRERRESLYIIDRNFHDEVDTTFPIFSIFFQVPHDCGDGGIFYARSQTIFLVHGEDRSRITR